MVKINQFVGHRIKSLRKSKGLTQAQLGDDVDLPQSYIRGIERGEKNISLDTFQKLILALDVSPNEIFNGFDSSSMKTKELVEILDRVQVLVGQRNIKEAKVVENFIIELFNTIDLLKRIQ